MQAGSGQCGEAIGHMEKEQSPRWQLHTSSDLHAQTRITLRAGCPNREGIVEVICLHPHILPHRHMYTAGPSGQAPSQGHWAWPNGLGAMGLANSNSGHNAGAAQPNAAGQVGRVRWGLPTALWDLLVFCPLVGHITGRMCRPDQVICASRQREATMTSWDRVACFRHEVRNNSDSWMCAHVPKLRHKRTLVAGISSACSGQTRMQMEHLPMEDTNEGPEGTSLQWEPR